MPNQDKLEFPVALQDKEILHSIHNRYVGKIANMNFSDPHVKSQLSLDLGLLVGLCAKLLALQQPVNPSENE